MNIIDEIKKGSFSSWGFSGSELSDFDLASEWFIRLWRGTFSDTSSHYSGLTKPHLENLIKILTEVSGEEYRRRKNEDIVYLKDLLAKDSGDQDKIKNKIAKIEQSIFNSQLHPERPCDSRLLEDARLLKIISAGKNYSWNRIQEIAVDSFLSYLVIVPYRPQRGEPSAYPSYHLERERIEQFFNSFFDQCFEALKDAEIKVVEEPKESASEEILIQNTSSDVKEVISSKSFKDQVESVTSNFGWKAKLIALVIIFLLGSSIGRRFGDSNDIKSLVDENERFKNETQELIKAYAEENERLREEVLSISSDTAVMEESLKEVRELKQKLLEEKRDTENNLKSIIEAHPDLKAVPFAAKQEEKKKPGLNQKD